MIKIVKIIRDKFPKKNNDIYSLCINAKGELMKYCVTENYK